jgi:hypothetical protein
METPHHMDGVKLIFSDINMQCRQHNLITTNMLSKYGVTV